LSQRSAKIRDEDVFLLTIPIFSWYNYIRKINKETILKTVFIFDLDGTLIDSEHRTPRDENGRVILEEWFRLATWSNIKKDTLLPLVRLFRFLKRRHYPLMVCTARTLSDADRRFFAENAIGCEVMLSRPKGDNRPDGQLKREMLSEFFQLRWRDYNKIMFDDNQEVLDEVAKIGVNCRDAIKANNHMEVKFANG